MKILWFTWKDLKHPQAGGAEIVNEELAKRLISDGHSVTFIVGSFRGAKSQEKIHGYQVIRLGNRWTVYWKAYKYYKSHLQGWADLVIDEVNTIPFFAKFYVKETNILFVHMLCRRIWFYQLPLPLSLIGYLLEPLYLRLLADRKTITVSKSTSDDLQRHGFKLANIHIISEGIELEPVKKLSGIQKYIQPTLLSLGALRPMKRTDHHLRAFEQAKPNLPNLRLIFAGDYSGSYGQNILEMIKKNPYKSDIEVLGKVDQSRKIELMQKSHLVLVTSIKEGWCLVVTEAASQGTPAIVYDVDGLRDSVHNNFSGYVISHSSPSTMASKIESLLKDKNTYSRFRRHAWKLSKRINFNHSYQDFKQALGVK